MLLALLLHISRGRERLHNVLDVDHQLFVVLPVREEPVKALRKLENVKPSVFRGVHLFLQRLHLLAENGGRDRVLALRRVLGVLGTCFRQDRPAVADVVVLGLVLHSHHFEGLLERV